jgi:YidC/Oxa1 family membrane protein insertase
MVLPAAFGAGGQAILAGQFACNVEPPLPTLRPAFGIGFAHAVGSLSPPTCGDGMEKRWIAFILIFLGAWVAFVVLPAMREQAEDPRQRAAAGAEILLKPTEGDPDGSAPTISASPDSAPDSRQQDVTAVQTLNLEDAPTHEVDTQLVHITFTTFGGVPISWEIKPSEYVAEVRDHRSGEAVTTNLIPQVRERGGRELPLQLEGRNLSRFNSVVYDVESSSNEGVHTVQFTSPVVDGFQVVRTYRIPDDSYLVDLELEIRNGEARTPIGDPEFGWGIGWKGGLLQPIVADRTHGQITGVASVGSSLRVKNVSIDDDPISYKANVGWAGLQSKYFGALIIPHPDNPATRVEWLVARRNVSAEYMQRGIVSPLSAIVDHEAIQLQPGETRTMGYSVFAGPKDYTLLASLDVPKVEGSLPVSRMVFGQMPLGQGWVRPICLLMLTLLRWFEGLVGNWGWAIILLVLGVKTALYPLSHWAILNQAKTMAEQNRIRPFVEQINEKYKNDAAKKSQELMKLYREHNINPLGMLRGCFPLLLQLPIFFALYILLDQAVELRGQSWFWIADLSEPDRLLPFGFSLPLLGWDALNILPLLMAATQFITSRMMAANVTDPMQKQIMVMMPIMFVIFLYMMPAGLMLYWFIQNVWQIGHTALTKRYVASHHLGTMPENSGAAVPAKNT